jgi:ArsR family transcriptional regulator, arsenate/arsenite/antimonite-responsive transcriptional repressor / arsenate reductase (thioredoxin)
MTEQPPEILKLLAHDVRWGLLKALTRSDQRVQELVARVDEPMNLVSYHLKKLKDAGIVTARRSEADGRDLYYRLEMATLAHLYHAAGMALHPSMGDGSVRPSLNTPTRVLFVCTHNSARSQMAEALFRRAGGDSVQVASAGSHPSNLHPDAILTMDQFGIDIRGQYAKSLDAVAGQRFDYVITVCDRAREVCPTFPGNGMPLHWGFPDPAAVEPPKQRRQLFAQIAEQLSGRIDYFLQAVSASTQSA